MMTRCWTRFVEKWPNSPIIFRSMHGVACPPPSTHKCRLCKSFLVASFARSGAMMVGAGSRPNSHPCPGLHLTEWVSRLHLRVDLSMIPRRVQEEDDETDSPCVNSFVRFFDSRICAA